MLQNRKLKDFYQRYNETSDVSVFTMAENAGLLRDKDVFAVPGVGETNLDFNPIYKKVFEEKKAIREGKVIESMDQLQVKQSNEIDPTPIIKDNTK